MFERLGLEGMELFALELVGVLPGRAIIPYNPLTRPFIGLIMGIMGPEP